MIGDSVLYGAIEAGQLQQHPQITLNTYQNIFDFCYNYATPGASWAGCFQDSQCTRKLNGLPNGKTLEETLNVHQDAEAVLFNLGGNDDTLSLENMLLYIERIKSAAAICKNKNLLFVFIGIIDINVTSTYMHTPITTSIYTQGYLPIAMRFASAAEILRQVCIHEGYPFIDVRNLVKINNWGNITGDLVHPSQDYSIQIFSTVAKAIQGQSI